MANAPIFSNMSSSYVLSYYGQEGTNITLQVDDTIDNLIEIYDDDNTLIGEHFHKASTSVMVTFKIFPIKSGEYELKATAKDITIDPISNDTILLINFMNKKDSISELSDTTVDTAAYLDLNFWFYKGTEESVTVKKMLENTTSGTGGYNTWDEYQESNFLPDVFSSSNIFKLLFTDHLMSSAIQDIHHQSKNLQTSDFGNLPVELQYSLDTYYNINTLWVIGEVASGTATTILIDETNEYPMLEILRDSKKFTYGTDSNITSLPIDEDVFLSTYYDNFETLTILNKIITVELYYLHYKLSDDFAIYTSLITLLGTIETIANNKTYHLMCSLYGYIVINKIMQKNIIDVTSNEYLPDYWSNS